MADTGGNLVISVNPQDGDNDITGISGTNELGYATIAALQIESVPSSGIMITPIPAALYLVGTGLVGIAGIGRRNNQVVNQYS